MIESHSEMIQRVRTSDLSRRVAWKGFLGVLWASIRYGLPSYSITNSESDRIVSKLFRPMFNVMGIHRTFPSEVVTLPVSYLGLGLPHPYIECARVLTFINNMSSETLTSKFISFSLQALQLETGVVEDVLTTDYSIWGLLATTLWIKDLWEFVHRHKIRLQAPYRILPKYIRTGDKGLMEEFYRIGYQETNLVRLNRVRNCLQVIYVSDITEGNGRKIRSCTFTSRKDVDKRSKFNWRREYPVPRDFALWRVAMSLLAPARVLPYPVGRWIHTSHQVSKWYYSPERDQSIYRGGSMTVFFVRRDCTKTRNSGQTFFMRLGHWIILMRLRRRRYVGMALTQMTSRWKGTLRFFHHIKLLQVWSTQYATMITSGYQHGDIRES